MLKGLFAGVFCAGLFTSIAFATDPPPAPNGAATSADPSAWYVIGVTPDEADLLIAHGDIGDDGDFNTKGQEETLTPTSGYIVVKLGQDDLLAISGVMMESSRAYGTGLMGLLDRTISKDHGITRKEKFFSCGRDSKTLVFRPQVGHVIYVGDLEYRLQDRGFWWPGSVEPHGSSDIEKARAYLKANHPELADRLEQAPLEMRHISYGCVGR